MSTWLESVGLTTLTKMNKNIDSLRGELMSEISTARESAYYDGYTDAQGNDEPISGNYGTGYNSQTDRYSSHGRQPEVLPNEMFEIAWKLWQSSPVAKRTLTMKRDFIIGGNIAITAEGDKYQDIIDDLVDDDEEGLSFRFLREIALQACALGEQLIPAHVRHKSDGLVRYGYIDPERIYRPIYDPDNSRSCLGVVVIAPDSSEKSLYWHVRKIKQVKVGGIMKDVPQYLKGRLVSWEQAEKAGIVPDALIAAAKECGVTSSKFAGNCFYHKENGFTNSDRGMSDLLPLVDWIEAADDVLMSLADREDIAKHYSYDVSIEGADENEIKKRTKQIAATRPTASRAINVHSAAETWKVMQPDLKQSGTIETFMTLLGMILGGVAMPVHWYGFGGEANLATAKAQGEPTYRTLEHDQGNVKSLIQKMAQFAIDQSVVTKTEDRPKVSVNLPEVRPVGMADIVTYFGPLIAAIGNAEDDGLINEKIARQMFAKAMNEAGVKYNPDEDGGEKRNGFSDPYKVSGKD